MLRFWHVSLLVLIALIWKVRPTQSAFDDCEVRETSMYCTCDTLPANKVEITCFIYGNVTSTDPVWSSIGPSRNIVALTLRSHYPVQLQFIPEEALKNMEALETLIIQEANLGHLNAKAIANLKSLSDVRLERDEITSLGRYSFSNLPVLQTLTLSENSITEIMADTFSNLTDLERLYLDRNNISRIESCGFCSLHNLKELDLARNNLMDLTEYAFRGLRFLTQLDLSYNRLRILSEKVFQAMPKLKSLNLEENVIDYVSRGAFYGLNELRELKLNNNKLIHLPGNIFQPMPKLISLYLLHNNLETISVEVVESLHMILKEHFIFLFRENPLKCGCDLMWIPRYLEKAKSVHLIKELKLITCQKEEEETVLAHQIKPKGCHSKKKEVSVLSDPTLSTLGWSNFKEATQPSPNDQSEYSESGHKFNRTVQKAEYNVNDEDSDTANAVNVNPVVLLCSTVVAVLFVYCHS